MSQLDGLFMFVGFVSVLLGGIVCLAWITSADPPPGDDRGRRKRRD